MIEKCIQAKAALKRDFKPPIAVLQVLKRAARPKDKVLEIGRAHV